MKLTTRLLSENETGAVYRCVLTRSARKGPARALVLHFTVTEQGALGFDNRQPGARACAGRQASRLLAADMAAAAKARVPGALSDRTEKGLAFELRVHNRAYRLGVHRSHSVTAEMGAAAPAAPDYDPNAVWFEHPLRNVRPILKALCSRE